MNEETLNKFLVDATIKHVFLYGDAIHLTLENGALLVIRGDGLDIDILGPDPPEREMLREMWDMEVEED